MRLETESIRLPFLMNPKNFGMILCRSISETTHCDLSLRGCTTFRTCTRPEIQHANQHRFLANIANANVLIIAQSACSTTINVHTNVTLKAVITTTVNAKPEIEKSKPRSNSSQKCHTFTVLGPYLLILQKKGLPLPTA